MKYKAYIDGLRAIAVISVVVYHAFPSLPYSGFIGVDIFFVISGYLISDYIITNLRAETLSLKEFYRRRILRLFPALVTVLFIVAVAGYFTFLAIEYEQLAKHIFSSGVFVQNLALANESGYFDVAVEKKPLLHLWSLSIEEQFYIFWPVFLYVIHRLGVKFIYAVLFTFILSFSLCLNQTDLTQRFYFPQYRFWELMFGTVVYLCYNKVQTAPERTPILGINKAIFLNLLSTLGILFLLLGFIFIRADDFPSALTIFPVLGCGLILLSGGSTLINKNLLDNRFCTFFGRISYPLYLWHWPIFSFIYILNGERPEAGIMLLLVALSILLSYLTYKYIETPIRFGGNKGKNLFLLSAAMVAIAIAGLYIYTQDGLKNRNANTIIEKKVGDIGHDLFHQTIDEKFFPCEPLSIRNSALKWQNHLRCQQNKKGNDFDVIILGDSHAEHLFLGFTESSSSIKSVYYIKGGMPTYANKPFQDIYHTIINSKAEVVILSAYWKRYLKIFQDSNISLEEFSNQISSSIKILENSGKTVVMLNDVPDFNFDPEKCKYARLFGNSKCTESIDNSVHEKIIMPIFKELTLQHPNLVLYDSFSEFCSGLSCSMSHKKQLLYRDRNHLNLNGSRRLGKKLAQKILAIKAMVSHPKSYRN